MHAAEKFVRSFAPGETVFCEGDEGSEMFVVLGGAIEIVKDGAVMARLVEGDIFGELALIDSGLRMATAQAAEQHTRLICIDQARFVYLVSQQPAFALCIMRAMARRMMPAVPPTAVLA